MRTLYPKLVQGRIQDYFSGGEAPLRNGVTEGEVKKKFKSFYLRGVRNPCTLPLDPALSCQDRLCNRLHN